MRATKKHIKIKLGHLKIHLETENTHHLRSFNVQTDIK